jgi:hypothetical protein
MDFSRYSLSAFEALASDADSVRRLADELESAILAEIAVTARERFGQIVSLLTRHGH